MQDLTPDEWDVLTPAQRGPCLESPNVRNRGGYARTGASRFGRKINYAHVLAWIDAHGCLPPEDGPRVLHHCDNPPCVNPRHLFNGTQRDNMQDSLRKDRNPHVRESCPECGGSYSLLASGEKRCLPCFDVKHRVWVRVNSYALKYSRSDPGKAVRREYLARTRDRRNTLRREKARLVREGGVPDFV
jgi:hypothetical protein